MRAIQAAERGGYEGAGVVMEDPSRRFSAGQRVLFFAGPGGVTEDGTCAEITSGALRREGGRRHDEDGGDASKTNRSPSAGRGWFRLGGASGQDEAAREEVVAALRAIEQRTGVDAFTVRDV